MVGGDHAITFPAVRGLSSFAPLNIVHFDAHLDYSHDIQDNLYTHASPIRRCRELDHVGHITSIGIRTARRRPYEEARRDGTLVISTKRFREMGPEAVAQEIPRGENLYITFDIDVMDPSQAPGTGRRRRAGCSMKRSGSAWPSWSPPPIWWASIWSKSRPLTIPRRSRSKWRRD